jgi:hypothetical protein
MDHVPDVEQAEAGHAVERRDERGVTELGFGVLDGGLIAFDLGDKLRNRGLLVGDLPRGADEVCFSESKTTSLTRASP